MGKPVQLPMMHKIYECIIECVDLMFINPGPSTLTSEMKSEDCCKSIFLIIVDATSFGFILSFFASDNALLH